MFFKTDVFDKNIVYAEKPADELVEILMMKLVK